MPQSTARRRAVYLLACLLPVWAVVAHFSGGVGWMLGPVRLSSRQPLRPFLIGLAIASWYVWRYSRIERDADAQWLLKGLRRSIPAAVPALVLLGGYVGVRFGTFAAAGSDAYGYISQAHLWLGGQPWVEQPWVQDFGWPNREWVFSPLGYRPVSAAGAIVPTYPAGLPLMMALLLGLFGETGPFVVVPVLAALLLWLTYLLGKQVTDSNVVAALATVFLLSSPAFLAHAIVPMSDVPAAAAWTLVAVLALKQRAHAAGLAAGAALLIRPNLALLALVPVFAWRNRREWLTSYGTWLIPGVCGVLLINAWLYGGPLRSGYGTLSELYGSENLLANLRNYAMWLVQTQTPVILLALVPLLVSGSLRSATPDVSPRACLAAMLGLTLMSYAFYAVFEHWLYLRFLLPAYPALFVLLAASLRRLSAALPMGARAPATATICTFLVLAGIKVAKDDSIFRLEAIEQRYVLAGAEIAARTPEKTMVLAVQHSGSVRYYSGRTTLRYDWLAADQLDAVIHELSNKGFRAFIVIDDWEEGEFRQRFAPFTRLGRLDWAPVVRLPTTPEVRIYELR